MTRVLILFLFLTSRIALADATCVLEKVLGQGAMGIVYQGRESLSGKKIAVKTAQTENLRRFLLSEFQILTKLQKTEYREDFPAPLRLEEVNGELRLWMVLLKGQDIKGKVTSQRPLTLNEAIRTFRRLAESVDAMHKAGVLHRDIKPANVFLESNGFSKLIDFGLAVETNSLVFEGKPFSGTPGFFPPEFARSDGKRYTAQNDLWALGVTLFYSVTGRYPFEAKNLPALMLKIHNYGIGIGSIDYTGVPSELAPVLRKILAPKTEDRFSSAREIVDALYGIKI